MDVTLERLLREPLSQAGDHHTCKNSFSGEALVSSEDTYQSLAWGTSAWFPNFRVILSLYNNKKIYPFQKREIIFLFVILLEEIFLFCMSKLDFLVCIIINSQLFSSR